MDSGRIGRCSSGRSQHAGQGGRDTTACYESELCRTCTSCGVPAALERSWKHDAGGAFCLVGYLNSQGARPVTL